MDIQHQIGWDYPGPEEVPEEKRIELALYLDADRRWEHRLRRAFRHTDFGQKVDLLKAAGLNPKGRLKLPTLLRQKQ
jgi:hypothetical protein